MRTIHFFLDFDGTIATEDVVDIALDKYADKSWKQIEQDWASGKIGSKECLAKQVELIRATQEELIELASRVTIDPHFVSFLKKTEELGVLVTIVSDGFDLFIETILKKHLSGMTQLLKALPIFSNKLVMAGKAFKAVFPHHTNCDHGCANCKPAVIKKLTSIEDMVLFVGDGLSDRYAAQKAHMTFAKSKLLKYCEEKNIDHIAFKDFKKIEQWLTDNYPMLKKASFGAS